MPGCVLHYVRLVMAKTPRASDIVMASTISKLLPHMDLHRMITELQAERQRLDEAIQALERLSAGKARRRGRPPAWLKEEVQKQGPGSEKSDSDALAKAKKA